MPSQNQCNPNRVAAGRRNRQLRGPITAAGREKLRQAALKNKPWEHATGPRTCLGKTRSAANGQQQKRSEHSRRALRAMAQDAQEIVAQLSRLRKAIMATNVEPNVDGL